MCIIIDNNVRDLVFGNHVTMAGERLRNRIDNRRRRLVIGGKLLRELYQAASFRDWLVQAQLSQQVVRIGDADVDRRTEKIREKSICRSDDEHVIALALESGCRVLCSADEALKQDFTDTYIVPKPKGKLYSLIRDDRRQRQNLMRWTRNCRACQ